MDPKKMKLMQKLQYLSAEALPEDLKKKILSLGGEPVEWDLMETIPGTKKMGMAFKGDLGSLEEGYEILTLNPGFWVFWQTPRDDLDQKRIEMELESGALWLGMGSIHGTIYKRTVIEPNGKALQYWAKTEMN